MVNRERLAETFIALAEIDSESGNELEISNELKKRLEELGASVYVDHGDGNLPSNTGNLIADVPGDVPGNSIYLCGHMDTVKPGIGVKVKYENGVFESIGDTILGSDDKSALAVILEVLSILKEKKESHIPLEVIFTVCEEVGLSGAKKMDYSRVKSEYGYILDCEDVDAVVKQAPAMNLFKAEITGKEAHAGSSPEEGISAIQVLADAVRKLPIGRIDKETTCNVGKIEGGLATNIVAGKCSVDGEIRSHSPEKLDKITRQIQDIFEETVEEYRKKSPDQEFPKLSLEIINEFEALNIPENHNVISMAVTAAENLGRDMKLVKVGGASDLNVFVKNGKIGGVLGTGMTDVHTLNETIKMDDMVKCAELILEIIRLHSTK